MAVMIPEQPLDFNGSLGERQAFEALRALPGRCYVFHSLCWLRRRGANRPPEGEGDLVIADPTRGILVIEVKSGGIRVHQGAWYQSNRADKVERPMQDPVAQACRTRWFLKERIAERFKKSVRCPVYHAVWFPSVEIARETLPLNCPSDLVLDQAALTAVNAAVDGAFAFGSGALEPAEMSEAQFRQVLSLLAPSFSAVPSVRQAIDYRERAFVRLTQEQGRVLDFLAEQDRAVVSGAAGSGKTMVALELARRLASEGREVLFLCYNRALRQFLQTHHGGPRVTFHTFDSMAAENTPELAGSFDAAKSTMLDRLTDPSSEPLSNVIVDEGQDFDDEWISALEASTAGVFYVFFDKNQLIQRTAVPAWLRDAECRLVLSRNCRSTSQIARFAHRAAGLPLPPDTVDGPRPQLHLCGTGSSAATRVAEIVADLLRERGLRPEEVAIVTARTRETSVLPSFERIGDATVSEEPARNRLVWTTVRKFKGLEAKAVVLVDFTPRDLVALETRRLLYVGASRAMHELFVVLHDCSPAAVNGAAAALLGPGKKRNAHALANELGAVLHKGEDNAEVLGE
jgi:UvrD-like helicase C-terminal domain/Nuclease-related domain/AAA domain